MTHKSKKRKGIFVVIDGRDGVGKSTATKLLEENIPKHFPEITAKRFSSPNPGLTERLLRRMLKSGSAKKFPNLFQGLFTLNRVIFQHTALAKALDEYDVVILDRWTASTWCYGTSEGCNANFIDTCLAVAKKPDYEIIFHGPSRRVTPEDHYEDDFMMQLSLMDLYEQWSAETYQEYYSHANTASFSIDVSEKDIQQVQDELIQILTYVAIDLADDDGES